MGDGIHHQKKPIVIKRNILEEELKKEGHEEAIAKAIKSILKKENSN